MLDVSLCPSSLRFPSSKNVPTWMSQSFLPPFDSQSLIVHNPQTSIPIPFQNKNPQIFHSKNQTKNWQNPWGFLAISKVPKSSWATPTLRWSCGLTPRFRRSGVEVVKKCVSLQNQPSEKKYYIVKLEHLPQFSGWTWNIYIYIFETTT